MLAFFGSLLLFSQEGAASGISEENSSSELRAVSEETLDNLDEEEPTESVYAANGTNGTVKWEIEGSTLTFSPVSGPSGTFLDQFPTTPWPWRDTPYTVAKFEGEIIAGTSLASFFDNATSLQRIEGIENLDTRKTTNMKSMFFGCSSLEELDVSHFDTSKVTDMSYMFHSCSSLNTLDVSQFDTSNVTTMFTMFFGLSGLEELDLTNFNTSKVTTMQAMFQNCSSLQNLNTSNFDTSNVTDMSSMFFQTYYLSSLNLSSFDMSGVTNTSDMFNQNALTQLELGENFTFPTDSNFTEITTFYRPTYYSTDWKFVPTNTILYSNNAEFMTGYNFVQWNGMSGTENLVYSASQLSRGITCSTFSSVMVFTAQWEAIPYTVTFDLSGVAAPPPSPPSHWPMKI